MARLIKTLPSKDEEKKQLKASDALLQIMTSKDTKDDHYNKFVSQNVRISTGSLNLDSVVDVRSGMVVRLVGKGAELGKTSSAFVLAENYMKTMPNAKTIFVKAEGRLSPNMQKRVGLPFVYDVENWEYGTVFVYCGNIAETIFSMIETVVKTGHEAGEHICVIIDSMDGLQLKEDAKKAFDGNPKVAGVPLITKLMFRKLALPISHFDALLCVTGQYAADIKISQYVASAPRQGNASGGSSIMHQSDYVFDYAQRNQDDYIKESPDLPLDNIKNKALGVYANITIRKSASDTTNYKVKVPIKKGVVGNAVWKSREVADLLLAYQYLDKSGSWLSWAQDVIDRALEHGITLGGKMQGLNNVLEYLEQSENKDALDFFEKELQELIAQ